MNGKRKKDENLFWLGLKVSMYVGVCVGLASVMGAAIMWLGYYSCLLLVRLIT